MFESVDRKFSTRNLRNFGLAWAAWASLISPALAQGDPEADFANDDVTVSSFGTVDLHVQDTDLAKVLQMLSMQSQKGIIASSDVSGTVTADLYDVTFYEALDAILNTNGYGYLEEGNLIKVFTLDELKQIQDSMRKIDHRIFKLDYINATDASTFATGLLSDSGSIAMSAEVQPGIEPGAEDGGENTSAHSDTLVVFDFPENIEAISGLIENLDTRPQQVEVEAIVLQTTLNEDNAWGIDWNIIIDADFGDFANPLSGPDDLLDGLFSPSDGNAGSIRSNVGQTAGPGGLKVGIVSEDISVFLRVLDEVSDTTVISRPRVMTLNRQRGDILVGRRLGYLSTTATQTSTTQTVEFLDTGTRLTFRPFIARDDIIRLELMPSVSEGIIRDVTNANGDTVTIPDEITQELQTNVNVRDGHTVVLGGLFKEQTTLTRRQVPILGDIPLIGNAFRGKDDTTVRSEITFLITPTIMHDDLMMMEGQDALNMLDRARIGVRKGVLPWSRDRMTAMHNSRAEDFLKEGNKEMAMWYIDQSLNMNPNQPQVMELRSNLTGTPDRWLNGQLFKPYFIRRIEERAGQVDTNNEFIGFSTKDPSPFHGFDMAETDMTATGNFEPNHRSPSTWTPAQEPQTETASETTNDTVNTWDSSASIETEPMTEPASSSSSTSSIMRTEESVEEEIVNGTFEEMGWYQEWSSDPEKIAMFEPRNESTASNTPQEWENQPGPWASVDDQTSVSYEPLVLIDSFGDGPVDMNSVIFGFSTEELALLGFDVQEIQVESSETLVASPWQVDEKGSNVGQAGWWARINEVLQMAAASQSNAVMVGADSDVESIDR